MNRASHPQRPQWIEPALRLLALGRPTEELTPETLAAAGAPPAAAFGESYSDLADFRLALLQHLLDLARASATQAAGGAPGGIANLKRGIEAYLDENLRHPALRELVHLLREQAAAQTVLARRLAGFHRVLQVGLSALRTLHPLASAQLVTAMVVDTALAEHEVRRPLPELRETIYAYLDRLAP